mmetsp:Transcript_10539/g.42613  ORF Transcript_10539/g.42613 Transcript_10539/m.42613 type:complete len:200 (-) Transcript_10539:589-1188(-)
MLYSSSRICSSAGDSCRTCCSAAPSASSASSPSAVAFWPWGSSSSPPPPAAAAAAPWSVDAASSAPSPSAAAARRLDEPRWRFLFFLARFSAAACASSSCLRCSASRWTDHCEYGSAMSVTFATMTLEMKMAPSCVRSSDMHDPTHAYAPRPCCRSGFCDWISLKKAMYIYDVNELMNWKMNTFPVSESSYCVSVRWHS